MSESSGEKTEEATPKKRADAAKEGDSLRSRDLGGAAAMAVLVLWLWSAGGAAVSASGAIVREGLTLDRARIDAFEPGRVSVQVIAAGVTPFALLGGALMLAAIIAGVALGSGWSGKAANFKWMRLDPAKGLAKLFGADAMIAFAQSVLKVAALLALGGWLLWSQSRELMSLAGARDGLALSGALLVDALALFAGVTVVAAAVDVLIQWQRREIRLRMSHQEVRDEHKSTEGSPERKRAQRERQYAIAHRSARKGMAEATVVITNPSHFAVALRYRPDVDAVPVVVARGIDDAARAIRDLASENAVPQIESVMLARAIYFTSKVGEPVVHDLYLAVATVLAFVFELDARMARGERSPVVEVPAALRFAPDGKPG